MPQSAIARRQSDSFRFRYVPICDVGRFSGFVGRLFMGCYSFWYAVHGVKKGGNLRHSGQRSRSVEPRGKAGDSDSRRCGGGRGCVANQMPHVRPAASMQQGTVARQDGRFPRCLANRKILKTQAEKKARQTLRGELGGPDYALMINMCGEGEFAGSESLTTPTPVPQIHPCPDATTD